MTYYDRLKASEPWMDGYIQRDLDKLRSALLEGPISSPDDYALEGFEGYRLHKLKVMKDFLQQKAAEGGFPPMSESELNYALSQMPGFDHIAPGIIWDYMSVLNFELFERKAFYLTNRLIDQLAHTELNAPSEFLRLPFPSCLFVLDGSTAIDALYAMTGNEVAHGNDPITVFAIELPYENGLRKLLLSCFHSGSTGTHIHAKRELLIHPKWSIEKSLKTDWARLYKENPDWEDANETFPWSMEDESPFYEEGLKFFRIIVNAILYLSSNDPDIIKCFSPRQAMEERLAKVKSTVKKKKARNELNKTSTLDYSAVGTHLPPILVDKGRKSAESGGSNKGVLDSATRFIVRGHWRNQPCGERLQDRRLIWIQPYFKGPDMGELINRPYIIE